MTVMDGTYLCYLVVIIELNLVYGGVSPSIYESCTDDCTLAPRLPCRISTTDYECEPGKYPTSLWPGAPEYLTYNVSYQIVGQKCVAVPRFQWAIPNDISGKSVKGFQLTVINMEGDYANYRVCVTFNLSTAAWKDSDIRMGLAYNYSCIILTPGVYYASIYSLPKPEMGADDRITYISSIIIHDAYVENGSCVPYSTSRAYSSSVSVTAYTGHQTTISATVPVHKREWPNWTAVGLGLISGLMFLCLMIIVVRRCSKRTGSEGSLIHEVPDADDPELFRPPSICNGVDIQDASGRSSPVFAYQAWGVHTGNCHSGYIPAPEDVAFSPYTPPVPPDDIASNFESLVGHINQ